jgi:hypothetical protein
MKGPFWCKVQSVHQDSSGSRLVRTPDNLCAFGEDTLMWTISFDKIRMIDCVAERVITRSGRHLKFSNDMGYENSGERIRGQQIGHSIESLVLEFEEDDVTVRIGWDELHRLIVLDQPEPGSLTPLMDAFGAPRPQGRAVNRKEGGRHDPF